MSTPILMTKPLQTELTGPCDSGVCILSLSGGIDYRSAPELRERVFAALDSAGDGSLLVDLADVRSIDTAGMAVLVEALVASRERGTQLFLCGAGEAVRKVFRLAGLQEALEHCTSCREEAERRLALSAS